MSMLSAQLRSPVFVLRAVVVVALIVVLAALATLIFGNLVTAPSFNITLDPATGLWP